MVKPLRPSPADARIEKAREAYAGRIKKVIDYIESHLDGDLSLRELCRVANVSPFHLHRQFSAYSGITVARLVRILRLKRASVRLAFTPDVSITEIALESGFDSPESFGRAFKRAYGQSPSDFRRSPQWRRVHIPKQARCSVKTRVETVDFPTTKVAAVEYRGSEEQSYSATMKLVAWRREHGVSPDKGDTYGVHYSDPETTPPEDYRLDICVSYADEVAPNAHGVVGKVIPGGRCARVRHFGSRDHIGAAEYLYREWLPASGEETRDYPIFFHYVNVGPGLEDRDMITDVYLPLCQEHNGSPEA